jgi:hypothetical protein
LTKTCALVEEAIDDGAELEILSKLSTSEAACGGLYEAFRAAIFADIPVITTVSSFMTDVWERFASGLSQRPA